MDKRDLLRSFSRVHNKKLTLLEQENDPRIEIASNVIAQGLQSGQLQPNPQGVIMGQVSKADGTPADVTISRTGTIGVAGKYAIWDSNSNTLSVKKSEEQFKAILTMLAGSEGAPGEPVQPEAQPVIDIDLDSELAGLGLDVDDPLAAAPFKELYDKAVEVTDRGIAKRLVRSLLNDYPVVVKEGEFYRIEPRQSNLERATELAEAINDRASEDFCDRFKKTEKGDVVVYTDYGEGSAGTVFSKSQAKALRLMFERDCKDTETINIIQEYSENLGGESNIRGNTLEYPPDLFALSRTYFQTRDSLTEDQRKKSESLIRDVANRIESGIRSLVENREAWLRTARDAAIPLESQAEFDKLMELLEDNGKNIQASFHVASVSNKERLPDLSVRSGEVTKKGRKQDSVEIWYEEDAAAKALGQKKLESVDAKDLFESLNKLDYYNELVDAGFLRPGQQVYVGEISYKNYIANANTVLGSFSDNNTDEFMSGKAKDNPVWKTFTKEIGSKTMAQYRGEFDAIHKEQMQIRKEIKSLSNNIETLVAGKKVPVKALNQVIETTLDNIQKNSDFSDIQRNKLFKTLSKKATAYKNAKTNKERKKIEAQMKDALLMPALMGSLRQRGPQNKAVQIYALGLNYAAGASYSNNTVLQTNMLNEGISYTTTQNKAYQEIAKSIRLDKGSWDLNITQSGLSFTRAENKKSSISLGMVRGNLQSRKSDTLTREGKKIRFLGAGSERQTASAATSGPDRLAPYDKLIRSRESLIWDSLNKLHEALGIIKEKVRILDTH